MKTAKRALLYPCLFLIGLGTAQALSGHWQVAALMLGVSALLSTLVVAVEVIQGEN